MKFILFAQLGPEKGIAYSRVHLARLIEAGNFPAPKKLSPGRVAWLEKDIDKWISDRPSARAVG